MTGPAVIRSASPLRRPKFLRLSSTPPPLPLRRRTTETGNRFTIIPAFYRSATISTIPTPLKFLDIPIYLTIPIRYCLSWFLSPPVYGNMMGSLMYIWSWDLVQCLQTDPYKKDEEGSKKMRRDQNLWPKPCSSINLAI